MKALKKQQFLYAFGLTGSISRAAAHVGIARGTHYNWLEDDAPYLEAFKEKVLEAGDRLEDEARRRAVAGVDEPIVYQGRISIDPKTKRPVTVKKYSDGLLVFLLKAWMPHKYGDRIRHTGPDDGPIEHHHRGVLVIGGSKADYVKAMRKVRGE